MTIPLDKKEKRILRYLEPGYDGALNLNDITSYLQSNAYPNISEKGVAKRLDHLIDVGYVRAKTEGRGNNRDERFYLSS